MTTPDRPDPARYLSHITASRETDALFDALYDDVDVARDSIAGLRRRRRRVSNDLETPVRSASLVEEDGVLYWRDGVPARPSVRRRGRRGLDAAADGSVILTREFPAIAPNKVVDAIARIDRRLNPSIDESLRSRLRPLRRRNERTFELDGTDVNGPFSGRTLLLVHGTFSNADNMLAEFTATRSGLQFVNRALQGTNKYDRVLFFDHPTLSVSPVLNALELSRMMAGSSGQIDVLAHSRGGLVVRWWLEAFGSSLRLASNARVNAVLAGSPLAGTSLAAPDKLQHTLSLISNIATFAEKTLGLVGVANPFLWVATKLVEVVVSVTGALARTPLVDALTALAPGLAGQSLVTNNHEIDRLRLGPAAVTPAYFAIVSDFETDDPGWKFWRNFRRDRALDLAADVVFPANNDLVVDTASMTSFGVKDLTVAGPLCDYQTSNTVWHCNYFRQQRSVDYIASRFGMPMP